MAFLVSLVLFLAAHAVHGDDCDIELKKHAAFFDRNHDGIIHVSETFRSLKALGLGKAESNATAFFIHTALSARTRPGGSFDPKYPILIENIHLGKHTSDTDSFDAQGRFVPEKFEEIFAKHAHTNATALNLNEIDELLKANMEPNDIRGSAAAKAEWSQLFRIGKDANNVLPKETVRKVFDGSLFFEVQNRRRSGK